MFFDMRLLEKSSKCKYDLICCCLKCSVFSMLIEIKYKTSTLNCKKPFSPCQISPLSLTQSTQDTVFLQMYRKEASAQSLPLLERPSWPLTLLSFLLQLFLVSPSRPLGSSLTLHLKQVYVFTMGLTFNLIQRFICFCTLFGPH